MHPLRNMMLNRRGLIEECIELSGLKMELLDRPMTVSEAFSTTSNLNSISDFSYSPETAKEMGCGALVGYEEDSSSYAKFWQLMRMRGFI